MKTKKLILSVLSLLVCVSIFVFAHAKDKEEVLLHFVQVSDTHLQDSSRKDGTRLLGSSEKLLKDTVSQINNIKDLDFALITGDLVDTPKESLVDKFIEITEGFEYPLYVTLGNHDVSVGGLGKKGFVKKFTSVNSLSFTDGMPYYSFSPNAKFTVICLDGTTDKVISANGSIQDKKQFDWLEKELEENKDKFVIIAMHFPLVEPYKSDSHRFLEPDRSKLLNLINSYPNVIGVFTGHYHAARLMKVKNKIHNSCPAVIQYPNAFREITITKDKKNLFVDFKWHPVNGEKLRNKSKESSDSWALTQGAKEDRGDTIKLKIY